MLDQIVLIVSCSLKSHQVSSHVPLQSHRPRDAFLPRTPPGQGGNMCAPRLPRGGTCAPLAPLTCTQRCHLSIMTFEIVWRKHCTGEPRQSFSPNPIKWLFNELQISLITLTWQTPSQTLLPHSSTPGTKGRLICSLSPLALSLSFSLCVSLSLSLSLCVSR